MQRKNRQCNHERERKFPYLLPAKHRFTSLVVTDAHINHQHGGVNITVTHLWQTYWILRIRQIVKTILRKCTTGRKVAGKAYPRPDPPPLTYDRIQESTPFSVTGVDFAGPLYVRNYDNTKIKVYICLFSCAASRAVHLEIVPNLTEESFILAFQRFTSHNSLPGTMISDNATTFIAADKEIQKLTDSSSLQEKLSEYGTEWKFIPKRAPWYGGFWEHIIGLTKISLKKLLGCNCVHLETLQTVITEIEAKLNDRPITYVSSDSSDPEPLTLSHLLCGRRITCLPYPSQNTEEGNYIENHTHTSLNQRVQNQQEIIQHFWTRWKTEYLTSLREYHRTLENNTQTIKVGDVVQIHEDSPRIMWKLAVVDELLPGKDGLVRAVKLHTSTGTTNRPIAKLYLIEVSDDSVTAQPKTSPDERKSKCEAMKKIRKWTSW